VWARGNFSNYDVDVAKGWDFDAAAYTGSAEIGYGFAFGGGWSLQPNGEITFISVDQGNYESKAYGFDIHPEDADSAVGRLGLHLPDTIELAFGAASTACPNLNRLLL